VYVVWIFGPLIQSNNTTNKLRREIAAAFRRENNEDWTDAQQPCGLLTTNSSASVSGQTGMLRSKPAAFKKARRVLRISASKRELCVT